MNRLPIVDCHHHLWNLDEHSYEWLQADPIPDTFLGDYRSICRNYLITDYLADAVPAGVVKSVHIQCEFDPSDPAGETRWLQGVADEHGFPHGIVAFADLSAPDVRDLLEEHARFANLRGIRQNLNYDKDRPRRSFAGRDYLLDDSWWRGFALLKRFDLSFDLQLLPHQMPDAAAGLVHYPDTTVIIDHAGLPIDRTPVGLDEWRRGMRLLARLPNTAVKLSGFPMLDPEWDLGSIRPIILETVDIFGSERCMFASNSPVCSLHSRFSQLFDAYQEAVAEFSADEQCALFAGNAERIYKLRPD